ncbi:MAG: hypothetical protein JSS62_07140 [Verrucomicrobia bacterium]|nr:hypothetical protein [Verrucomicrobiota bacterium]MBS0645876.1 hypothetical protein [Verrucomicrobiota bacterium]
MHETLNIVFEKYKEKHKEVEKYLKSQGEIQITFSVAHIKKLLNSGKIPKELGEWFLKDYENIEKRLFQRREFLKSYPDNPIEERSLTFEEEAKLYEDMFLSSQFLMYLIQNKHLLEKEESLMTAQGLFNDIDTVEEFGVANCISNSLYHLRELLKTMKLVSLYEGLFEAKSSVRNSKGEAISLTYTFPAHTEEEAQAILKNYQSTMATKGLKVWMAYWIMANKLGRVEYSCLMIDVMKMVADEDREAFFSVKEKEEHWALTKMLRLSKLSRERKIRKKGTSTEVLQWVEQPFLEIQGGEKEITAEDKYPLTVSVRVLMPRMDKKGFAPTIYKNNTALLSPSDTLLAFLLQTRAGQMNRGSKNLHYDWDFIFEAGNLQPTALSNPRGAKAKARKKMDRLQKNEIIEKWNEELMGVCVTPKKQTRKECDKDKKNIT